MDRFFPVSIFILQPNQAKDFRVYLKRNNNYVLLTKEKERFTDSIRNKLYRNGINTVFVPANEALQYDHYLEENLGSILGDDNVPIEVKSELFYDVTSDISHKLFNSKIPESQDFSDLIKLIDNVTEFLSNHESIKTLSNLIDHDYYSYTHCVHVFIFSTYLLHLYGYKKAQIKEISIGSFLHDIGKQQIPDHILNKPGKLDENEWEVMKQHPNLGIKACEKLSLSNNALKVIRFHHEKIDGSGYPLGIKNIPHYVQIITCCDIYDALTSKRVYSHERSPFEAFKIMQSMEGQIDKQILKTFIQFIGGL